MAPPRGLRLLASNSLFSHHATVFPIGPRQYSKRMGSNPQANQPDSNAANVRRDTPNTDRQSSASNEEHKQGDAHPAKQPDPQPDPPRKTGIGGKEGVAGGKEGLGERDNR